MAYKTPIMLLQEFMVSKKEAYPDYSFESVGNLLTPQFCCTVKASTFTAVAYGKNKKEAKQQAAANALRKIQTSKLENGDESIDDHDQKITTVFADKTEMIPIKHVNITTPKDYVEGLNYVGQLNEYATRNNCVWAVKYEDSIVFGSDQFQMNCILDNLKVSGYSRNKKQAKQIVAFEMLKLLKSSNYKFKNIPISCKIESNDEVDSKAIEKFNELSINGIVTNPKAETDIPPLEIVENKSYSFKEATEILKESNLSYTVEELQKNPCMVVVQIKEKPITAMGVGDDKSKATVYALNKALEALSC